MRIGLIWAEARGGAIGRDGDMPWHVPEDLAHFKATTLAQPVIMGRRTWQSLPERFRPLPGRTNLVVTRDPGYEAQGATVCGSLGQAIAAAEQRGTDVVWVMGGGQLYREAIDGADELVVTRIELDVDDADTFAPPIDERWQRVESSEQRTSVSGLGYRFERWVAA